MKETRPPPKCPGPPRSNSGDFPIQCIFALVAHGIPLGGQFTVEADRDVIFQIMREALNQKLRDLEEKTLGIFWHKI